MLYLFYELVQEEELKEFRERLKRQPTATYVPIECAGKILEKVHQLRSVFANVGRTFLRCLFPYCGFILRLLKQQMNEPHN